MSETQSGPGPGFDRRQFIREGFRNLIRPIAKVVGDRIEKIRMPPGVFAGKPGREFAAFPGQGRFLRPPGAIREERFVEKCRRSGACVAACPVAAIRPLSGDDPALRGTPAIRPRIQACIVCEDLSCMKACTSGALSVLPRHLLAMGVAAVDQDRCLRSTGDECQVCMDSCPIGRKAIDIPYYGAKVEVRADGCVGCGICEMKCPAEPAAITVVPIERSGRSG
jgi:ferredoxin-type protein NapG